MECQQRLESLEEAEVGSFGTTTEDELKELKDNTTRIIKESQARLNIFGLMEQTVNQDDCPICLNSLKDQTPVVAGCGHMYCSECINITSNQLCSVSASIQKIRLLSY